MAEYTEGQRVQIKTGERRLHEGEQGTVAIGLYGANGYAIVNFDNAELGILPMPVDTLEPVPTDTRPGEYAVDMVSKYTVYVEAESAEDAKRVAVEEGLVDVDWDDGAIEIVGEPEYQGPAEEEARWSRHWRWSGRWQTAAWSTPASLAPQRRRT